MHYNMKYALQIPRCLLSVRLNGLCNHHLLKTFMSYVSTSKLHNDLKTKYKYNQLVPEQICRHKRTSIEDCLTLRSLIVSNVNCSLYNSVRKCQKNTFQNHRFGKLNK